MADWKITVSANFSSLSLLQSLDSPHKNWTRRMGGGKQNTAFCL